MLYLFLFLFGGLFWYFKQIGLPILSLVCAVFCIANLFGIIARAGSRSEHSSREKTEQQKQETETSVKATEIHRQSYQELSVLYEDIARARFSHSLSRLKETVELCGQFAALCDQLLADSTFLADLSGFAQEHGFDAPLGYYDYSESPEHYLRSKRSFIASLPAQLQAKIDNSEAFSETLAELPRAVITRSPASFEPDAEPDFNGITFSNITSRTNLERVNDFIAVDVETTGLRPHQNEIIQLSAVKFSSFEPVECFTTYIKPRKGIKAEAQAVNGITEEMVADAPAISEVIDAFRAFTGDKLPLVGHNLLFDLKFLVHAGCVTLDSKRKYFDTLELARRSGIADSYKLDDLGTQNLDIVRDDAHDALSDALLTGCLFHGLCDIRAGGK